MTAERGGGQPKNICGALCSGAAAGVPILIEINLTAEYGRTVQNAPSGSGRSCPSLFGCGLGRSDSSNLGPGRVNARSGFFLDG